MRQPRTADEYWEQRDERIERRRDSELESMMMKRYLERLIALCSEEAFGQDAVEWAILSGHIKLTYNQEQDLKHIMGIVPTTYQVQATDKDGRVSTSTHATKEAAESSAARCRGRHPWGNRVRVVETASDGEKPVRRYDQIIEAYQRWLAQHEEVQQQLEAA